MKLGRHKKYVEFVGAHGAGKTSIFHAIAEQDRLAPLKAVYSGQIKRSKALFMLQVPIFVLLRLRHIIFLAWFFFRYAKFCWVNYYNAARPLFKMIILHPYFLRFEFDVLFKDDMLHLIPRIIFKNKVNVEDAMREYFEHFSYLYDGLVFVDIDLEVMSERFKERFPGKSRTFKEGRRIIHERAFEQNKILKRVIVRQKEIPYLILHGGDDIQENAQKAAAFIKADVLEE